MSVSEQSSTDRPRFPYEIRASDVRTWIENSAYCLGPSSLPVPASAPADHHDLLVAALEANHTAILNSGNTSKSYSDHWHVYEYLQFKKACESLSLNADTAIDAWKEYYAKVNTRGEPYCCRLTVFTDEKFMTRRDKTLLATGELVPGGL